MNGNTVGRYAVLFLLGSFLSACTPASRMVREAPPPDAGIPIAAHNTEDRGVVVTVERVVVRNGPGAWVRDAAWDEYAVVASNTGAEAIAITGASLTSEHLDPAAPTAQLDALERGTSKGLKVLKSAGVAVAAGYLAGSLAFAGAGGSQLGVIAGASAAAVMIPVAAVAAGIYMHKRHKRQRLDRELMQAEIERRALALPLELAAGAEASGSLFFPITPAPRQLQVRYVAGGVEQQLAIDLPGLSQLHIKPGATPAQAQAQR